MSSITGVSQAVAAQTSAAAQSGSRQQFSTDMFLQLLVTQLRYQDPMSGSQDTGELITQLTLFTLLEQVVKLQQSVDKQSQINEHYNSLNLLNREVTVVAADGSTIFGPVSAVYYRENGPYVTVNNNDYPLSAIIRVGGESAPEEGDHSSDGA